MYIWDYCIMIYLKTSEPFPLVMLRGYVTLDQVKIILRTKTVFSAFPDFGCQLL